MASCPGNKKFITTEARAKSILRTEGIIDEFLIIKKLNSFRTRVSEWSNKARYQYGIQERLFDEDQFGNNLKAVPNKRAFKAIDKAKGINYQLAALPASIASPATIAKLKRVMENMGVKLQSLSHYLEGNPDVRANGINALADLVRGIIAVTEGKENVALTEEMVHIATAILEQTRPRFITEMISKIGNFKIYNQVLKKYKNNPKYQLPDGKPDIRKIKKEAVDKLIAEVIINQNEGSTEFPELMQEVNRSIIRTWWQKILDWFRGEYRKANINIFEEAAQEIISGRTGVRYYNDNKLGVDRIFDENPELANAVYEALGFTNEIVLSVGREQNFKVYQYDDRFEAVLNKDWLNEELEKNKKQYEKNVENIDSIIKTIQENKTLGDNISNIISDVFNGILLYDKEDDTYKIYHFPGSIGFEEFDHANQTNAEGKSAYESISLKDIKRRLIQGFKTDLESKNEYTNRRASNDNKFRIEKDLQYYIDTYYQYEDGRDVGGLKRKGYKIPEDKGYIIREAGGGALKHIPGAFPAIKAYFYYEGKHTMGEEDAYVLIDKIDDTGVYIRYTTVKKELRGKGIASLLLNRIRKDYQNLPIIRTMIDNPIIVEQSRHIKGARLTNGKPLPTFENVSFSEWQDTEYSDIYIPPLSESINQITPQQEQQAQQLYSQYLDSLSKPNTNPILKGNQREQVKKFTELQERLNNKEFIEGAKNAYESSKGLQEWGTQEQYNDYIARVSLGIIRNPSSGGYNYTSKVKDIVYHGSPNKIETFDKSRQYVSDTGFFSSDSIEHAKKFSLALVGNSPTVHSLILNAKNPKKEIFTPALGITENKPQAIKRIKEEGHDSIIFDTTDYGVKINEYIVFEPEQIHILGSKQDIEGFKEWAKTAPAEFKGEGVFFQISDAQKRLQKRILDTKANIEKRESKEEGDPILLDTEEANNWYVLRTSDGNWERITKRVTDRVKSWYKQRFPDKTFTEEEKELNEFKRIEGVKGHKFLEEIHKRFFDDEGIRRESPLARPVINNAVDREIYHKLEKYYVELIDKFSKDGKKPMVFSEVIVYDSKQKEAGTIDLLIVEESGRANIIDWKFLSVGKDATDIAWYKQGAYNIQLSRYKDILMKQYGVKSIGMNRAVPILLDINYKDLGKKDSKHQLKGIVVGSVDVSKIKSLTLTPVSEESESTELLFEGEEGWQKLDKLIIKLNSLYKQIAKKKATDEEERDFKRERLNSLRSAIRAMQSSADLTPLIETISLMRREGEMIIDDWNTKYRDVAANNPDINNSELSDFAESLREYRAISDIFRTIDRSLGHLIYNSDMENDEGLSEEDIQFRKDVLSKVQEEARLIDESYENVVDISKKFADKFMGVRNLVAGLLKPEAIVRGLGATFRGVSELPLKSLEILYKMITNAKAKATQDALKEVNRLLEIRTKLAERGGDLRQLVRQIYQKDEEGKLVNKLIYRYDKGFYDGIKNNSLEGNQDKNWLQDNVDMVAYKAEADEVLRKRIERINDIYKNNRELRESLILQENRKWDTTRADFTGWNNYILKRHPLPKWESAEYKELKKDADLLDLYNFIHSMNEKAVEAGYISNRLSSTFLPWVRKSLSESLAWDFSLSAIGNWSKELTLRAGDVGYGQVNELTGEYEYAIPKYYSYDFTKDDKGYENVSEDIFKNMILYINHMEKYKYMSDIEQQLLLVKNIETFKQHLDTARNGDVVNGIDGKPTPLGGNEENTRMFDTFLRALLYEQKYPLSAGDTPLGFGKAANYVKSAINKVAGREIYKIDEEASVTSLTKSIDAINRGFQLKTLGFEFISGAVNMFGGNIQMATQAGNYFKAKEFMANEVKLLGNKFKHDDERDMFIQLIDTFMPLKDDPTYERLKKAGMSTLTRGNFSDIIMMFMRQPELHLERSVFLTLLENMMIVDGRIISIREYVKSKYKNRYTTGSIYKESSKQIEAEIAELRETKSIYATKKLVDGKLEIPGLDLSNRDELQRLTTLTRRLSRNATGGLSDSDLNNMSFNVWTKSMMVFKNWIPKLVDTRFGEFRKIHDDFSVEIDDEGLTTGEKYDIGRIRLFFGLIGMSVRDKGNHIMNILEMNDKGIEILDRMYEEYAEKYERQTGETMNLSREEFIDLIRNNLSNQMKELGMLLSLVAASFALGFIGPDDDDDSRADKNFYRFWQRVFDRFIQELSFFYNPVEFQKMLSGSAFPAIGLISDMLKAMDHFTMQVTGYDISNLTLTEEEVREKAQPIKNIARMFPGTKSLMTYGSILSEDWAREFDITIQKETRK